MHAIDVTHERRVDAVAEQRPDAVGEAPRRRANGQDHLLLLAGPRLAVLRRDRQSRAIRAVGAASVPQRPRKHDDGTGRHLNADDPLVVLRRCLTAPAMAAGDDLRRAVLGGELVDRPNTR